MKRSLTLSLLALSLSACNGDSFTPSPELLEAAQCAGLSLDEVAELYNQVGTLLGSIGGVIPPNMTYDIGTGAYTITLSFGALAGTVTTNPAGEIDDGFDVGETATATWELNGGLAGAPTATGEGTFTFARNTATTFAASGNGELLDGTCAFDMNSLNLAEDTTTPAGPIGTINFETTTPGGTLTGLMTFNGSDFARITGEFAGEPVTFYINLDTFLPEF